MRARLRWFNLRRLSLLNGAGLALLWILENGVAERTALTALLLYLPQHPFLLLSLILLVCSAWKRRRKLTVFNAAVTLIFAVILLGLHVPWSRLQGSTPGSTRVRVMTWNVRLANGGTAKLAAEIKAQQPDIVCLQETTGRRYRGRGLVDHVPELLRRFADWHVVRAGEVTVISRLPLLHSVQYPHPKPSRRAVLATTWQTAGGPLDVLVAHISTAPPQSHFAGRRVADGNRLLETLRNVRGTAQTRLSQLPTLDRALNDAQNSGHPYVLAGDFNNPPRGISHRHLKARLTDGFAQAGWGSGFSFPARLPLMRIDYLWLGRGVRARRVWVTDTSASDHRAVVGDLDIVNPNEL